MVASVELGSDEWCAGVNGVRTVRLLRLCNKVLVSVKTDARFLEWKSWSRAKCLSLQLEAIVAATGE